MTLTEGRVREIVREELGSDTGVDARVFLRAIDPELLEKEVLRRCTSYREKAVEATLAVLIDWADGA